MEKVEKQVSRQDIIISVSILVAAFLFIAFFSSYLFSLLGIFFILLGILWITKPLVMWKMSGAGLILANASDETLKKLSVVPAIIWILLGIITIIWTILSQH